MHPVHLRVKVHYGYLGLCQFVEVDSDISMLEPTNTLIDFLVLIHCQKCQLKFLWWAITVVKFNVELAIVFMLIIAWSNLAQEIQFWEFMGGSNL